MREEDILRIQDELMNGIDKNNEAEEMVKSLSKDIALALSLTNKTTAEVKGIEYMFIYKAISKNKINMIVGDISKFRILKDKYTPYTVSADIENNFTLKENLESIVESFLRHILDMVKVDEL